MDKEFIAINNIPSHKGFWERFWEKISTAPLVRKTNVAKLIKLGYLDDIEEAIRKERESSGNTGTSENGVIRVQRVGANKGAKGN